MKKFDGVPQGIELWTKGMVGTALTILPQWLLHIYDYVLKFIKLYLINDLYKNGFEEPRTSNIAVKKHVLNQYVTCLRFQKFLFFNKI